MKKLFAIFISSISVFATAQPSTALPQADVQAQCRLPELGVRSDVGLGFPRIPDRLKTKGDVRFTVIFVDFSDVPAIQSPQEVMSIISPEAEKYYKAVSYGKMNLIFDAHNKWIRMRKTSFEYGFKRGSSFEV